MANVPHEDLPHRRTIQKKKKKQGRREEGAREGVKEQGIICNKYSALLHCIGGRPSLKRVRMQRSVEVSTVGPRNMTLGEEDPRGSLLRTDPDRDDGGRK